MDKIPPLFVNARNKIISIHCVILFITFISFYPTLENGWTSWDDDVYVIDNPAVQQFSKQNITEVFFTAYNGSYLPLTMISYMVDYSIDGFNPTIFHSTNLIFHLINTIFIFWFLFLLSGNILGSGISALLFGIHPMRVESVAWIAARKDVLSMFFFLSSLISYVQFVKKRHAPLLVLTFLFFCCALFSKVIVITLPLILLLIDYYLNREYSKDIIIEKIPFFMTALALSIIGFLAQKYENAIRPTVNILDSFVVSLHGIIFYLQKFIIPFKLSSLYPYPEKHNGWLPVEFYLFALLALIAIIIVFRFGKSKPFLFGVLFFLISLLPVLQFIRFSKIFAADRFTYFAYIGLFFIVGHQLAIAWERRNRYLHIVISFLLVVVIGYFAINTWQRTKIWENNKTLWKNVLTQYPNALNN